MKIVSIKDGQILEVVYDNGVKSSVPKANGNMEYEKVKEALQGGTEDYPTAIPLEPEFTEVELLERAQADFRAERNTLLLEADIEINRRVDNNLEDSVWRVYRQELRDATLTWVMPTRPAQ